MFSFNVLKVVHKRWSEGLAPYFATSSCVRNSVFALSCLMLWTRVNVMKTLQTDLPKTFLTGQSYPRDFSHVYKSLGAGHSPGSNLMEYTYSYFDQSLIFAQELIQSLRTKTLYVDMDIYTLHFSNSITYVYVGLLPDVVMPLFDPFSNHPMDLLEHCVNYVEVALRVCTGPELSRDYSVGVLNYLNFGRRKWTSRLLQQMRVQLSEMCFGGKGFIEIDSRTCKEFGILEDHLNSLESSMFEALNLGAPLPIFEYPFMLSREFVALVREFNEFALRILLLFSCICIYCGFYILKSRNMWASYIDWFCSRNVPIGTFDSELIRFVNLSEYRANNDFKSWLEKLDNLFDFHAGHSMFDRVNSLALIYDIND